MLAAKKKIYECSHRFSLKDKSSMSALILGVSDCCTLTCFLLSAGVSIILFFQGISWICTQFWQCEVFDHQELKVWQLALVSTSLIQAVALSCYDVLVQYKKNSPGLWLLTLWVIFVTFCFQLKYICEYSMYRKGSICISKVKPNCPSYTVGVKILINPPKGWV